MGNDVDVAGRVAAGKDCVEAVRKGCFPGTWIRAACWWGEGRLRWVWYREYHGVGERVAGFRVRGCGNR